MENSEKKAMEYAESLSRLIQFETVSNYDSVDLDKFEKFHVLLKETFPTLFSCCEVEDFDGSLLLRWKGSQNSGLPTLFMNHHDVVEATGNWSHKPFSGDIENGVLWGRGTLDTKGGLFCMLEAGEELAKNGFVPENDIYFESSCTEETTGSGARKIAEVLLERGIKFKYLLDEGGMILYDPIGGADGTYAMVGVGEKACVDLKFVAKSRGGHASMPPKNTPFVRLSKFILDVEKDNTFKTEISPTITEMFRRFSPKMKGATKFVLGHSKLFNLPLRKILPKFSPTVAALFRTTIAFTMADGSNAYNVIPENAWISGNMRCSHHEGIENSVETLRKIAKKYDVTVEIYDGGYESSLSDFNDENFKRIEEAVSANFKDVETVPYVMTGASDARFFDKLTKNCYRFVPFVISDKQLSGIHGLDESVDISTLVPAVNFYKYLMER